MRNPFRFHLRSLALAVLAGLATQCARADGPVARLRDEARAADRFVRLGDVADLEGDAREIARLARLILAEAPAGDEGFLKLERRDIDRRLGQMGLREALSWRGAESVRVLAPVATAGRPVNHNHRNEAAGGHPPLPEPLDTWVSRHYAPTAPSLSSSSAAGKNIPDYYAPPAVRDADRFATDPVYSLLTSPPAALAGQPALDDESALAEIYFTAYIAGAPTAICPALPPLPDAPASFPGGHADARPAAMAGTFDGRGNLPAGAYGHDPLYRETRGGPAVATKDATLAAEGEVHPETLVREAIERHLLAAYPRKDAEITVFVKKLSAPPPGPIHAVHVLKGRLPGAAQVILRADDRTGGAVDLLAEVEAVVDLPGFQARRPFEKGQAVRMADLRREMVRVTAGQPLPLEIADGADNGEDWVAARRIVPGKALAADDLVAPFTVSRNDALTVESNRPGAWSASFRAIALEDGRLGDRITARDAAGGGPFLVRISGPGRADFLGPVDGGKKVQKKK